MNDQENEEERELTEEVVSIRRVSNVVKGGKNFAFSALVVVGNEDGKVGWGLGKSREVPPAIEKGIRRGKKNLTEVSLQGDSIPHEVTGVVSGGKVILKPASPGTGVIAGGAVRPVVEVAGVKDVLTKSLGSDNHVNIVKATIEALKKLRTPEEVARLRGKDIEELGLSGPQFSYSEQREEESVDEQEEINKEDDR